MYRNPDGTERRELRPESEVFKLASMNTFRGVPFTDDHPEDLLTAATATQYAKGATGDSIVRDDDHLRGTITVYDAATIRKMDAGKLDVSCGYSCDLVETPGVHPVWGKHDAIQTNIVGNHLALVDQGRAGSAAIRMDAAIAYLDGDWNEGDHPRAEDGKFGASSATREANAATSAANRESAVRGVASSKRITEAHEKAAHAHFTAMAVHGGGNKEAAIEHGKAAAAHTKAASESRAGRDAGRDLPEVGKTPRAAPARAPAAQPSKLQALVNSAKQARQPAAPPASTPDAEAARKHAFDLGFKAADHPPGSKEARTAHLAAAAAHDEAAAKFHGLRDKELAGAHESEADRHRTAAKTGAAKPTFRGTAAKTTAKPRGVTPARGVAIAKSTAAGALNTQEKALLKAMATAPKQRGSDSKVLKALGLAPGTAAAIANSARDKLGLTPMDDLRAHAKAMHKSKKLDAFIARMDAMSDNFGIALALHAAHGTVDAMARRTDVTTAAPDSDPDDLASRNARNPEREDAPVTDPDADPDEDDADPDEDDADPDEDEEDPATLDDTMYDADGELTDDASKRMGASCYAVPSKSKLAIHDPLAVKDSMKRFGAHEFDSADEKHAAFNRITARATQFGIGTTKFARQHAATLDRKDQDMTTAETAAAKLAAKKAKRQAKYDAAIGRATRAETDLAAAHGKITSLETDLAAAKAETGKRSDAAQTEFAGAVSAKADLIIKAIAICGVRKDSKLDAEIKHYSAMDDVAIKCAIIKHVDKTEVPTDKHPAYVDALFDGALSRATKDAAATLAGANALAAARGAAFTPTLPVTGTSDHAPRADADDDSEEAAAARMRTRTANLSRQPGRFTRDLAEVNGSK